MVKKKVTKPVEEKQSWEPDEDLEVPEAKMDTVEPGIPESIGFEPESPDVSLRTIIEKLVELDAKFDKTFTGHTLTRGHFIRRRRSIVREEPI